MGWNDPGKGQDPWGRKSASKPFDLDATLQRLWRRLRRHGGAPPRWVFIVAIFAAAAGWLVSGFYSVPPGDRGVLLQMGREAQVVQPGPHWRWPAPFASDQVVSVRQIHIVAIGYRRTSKLYEGEPAPAEAAMLTQNQGIIHLQFAVQYRIADPRRYLFNIDHPRKTIARAAEAVMREAVAKNPSGLALSTNERGLEGQVKQGLQRLLDRYQAGVHVVAIKIQKALPPKSVLSAVQKVVRAREDAKSLNSQAQAYADTIIPRAQADGAALIDKAKAYKAKVIAAAKGRASRFLALAKVYAQAPQLTRERLFIEATARVYAKARKILVAPSPHAIIHITIPQAPAPAVPMASPPPPAPPVKGTPP